MNRQPVNYEQLWSLFSKGDMSSFRRIYSDFYPVLMQFGLLYLPKDDVENLIQDLFLYILERRSSLRSVSNVKAYLITGLRNRISKNATQNKIRLEKLPETTGGIFGNSVFEPELIPRLLQKLTPREQEVIRLRYFKEYKNKEIAQKLHIEYQTVRNILYQAIQKLRIVFLEIEMG